MNKRDTRLRRARRTRARIRRQGSLEAGVLRLCVHRTPRHIYAQVTTADGQRVLAQASSTEKVVREKNASTGNVATATMVGELLAERAVAQSITKVAFDRSGFKYHGRLKALADAARNGGVQF